MRGCLSILSAMLATLMSLPWQAAKRLAPLNPLRAARGGGQPRPTTAAIPTPKAHAAVKGGLPAGVAAAAPALTPCGNVLPPVMHRVLNPEDMKPGRVLIIGDVHGCRDELDALLQALAYDPGLDNVVFVGDLVNKGPKSLEVLDAFLQLGALGVRGNHDDRVLQRWHENKASTAEAAAATTAEATAPSEGDDERGGAKELRGQGNDAQGGDVGGKHAWIFGLKPQHVAALEALPFTLNLTGYNVTVVHAGLVPGLPLDQQDLWAMYKMRNLKRKDDGEASSLKKVVSKGGEDGDAGSGWVPLEKAKEGGEAWAGLWPGPGHVFFGHDAKRKLQVEDHATGLDTACVYGGKLTAAVLPPLDQLLHLPLPSDHLPAVVVGQGGGPANGFGAKVSSGAPLTRQDLRVVIVSVPAFKMHVDPNNK